MSEPQNGMSTGQALNWILEHDCVISNIPQCEIAIQVFTPKGAHEFFERYGDGGPSLIRVVQRAQEWLRTIEAQK